jgi:multiple sugar transport system permease protein
MAPPAANPLRRSHPAVHLPLAILGIVFALPFVWLLSTSLQPREQAMSTPPQWLPRLHVLTVDGGEVFVTPPEKVAGDRRLVELTAPDHAGQRLLVARDDYAEGTVPLPLSRDGRTETVRVAARVLQEVPDGSVAVVEWRLSKYGAGEPRRFYARPDAVRRVIHPVGGNYPEAIRALTSDPVHKQKPLGTMLEDSRMPWHGRDSQKPVTFLTYLANTLTVTVLGMFGTLLSSSLVAYGLARIPWRGRGVLFAITLGTMMVPFPVIMVPLFAVFRELGWIGTLLPLWVPAWFGSAFNIFLLRQFFLIMPEELSEAARIDGASELRIWWSIALPLARPALAVVALFHFLHAWNDFLGPLIYLTRPETFTLALGLQQYQSQSGGSEWHLLMASSVLMVVPVIVLFFFTQKTLIRGIATTGMKA